MSKPRHILVAVDKFPQSNAALARAVELGNLHRTKVTVVHVVAGSIPRGARIANRELVEEQAQLVAKERIDEAIRACKTGNLSIDVQILSGSAASCVVKAAEELGADLVVLRAHQRLSVRERMIGSTADQIIRSTPASVLVVKRPVERAYRHAIVAVDSSDASESAAIMSAKLCARMVLQLVHFTYVAPQFLQSMQRAGTNQAEIDAYRQALRRKAEKRMHALAERMQDHQPAPRVRVIEGEPSRALVQLTWSRTVDLITVGPYEHGAIRLALLGSVTQRLLREAACDVLISRPYRTP